MTPTDLLQKLTRPTTAQERRNQLIGRSIWALVGAHGWRPAVIVAVGQKYDRVRFENGRGGYGRRSHWRMAWRNPFLCGRDKPSRAEAREACRLADKVEAKQGSGQSGAVRPERRRS